MDLHTWPTIEMLIASKKNIVLATSKSLFFYSFCCLSIQSPTSSTPALSSHRHSSRSPPPSLLYLSSFLSTSHSSSLSLLPFFSRSVHNFSLPFPSPFPCPMSLLLSLPFYFQPIPHYAKHSFSNSNIELYFLHWTKGSLHLKNKHFEPVLVCCGFFLTVR